MMNQSPVTAQEYGAEIEGRGVPFALDTMSDLIRRLSITTGAIRKQ